MVLDQRRKWGAAGSSGPLQDAGNGVLCLLVCPLPLQIGGRERKYGRGDDRRDGRSRVMQFVSSRAAQGSLRPGMWEEGLVGLFSRCVTPKVETEGFFGGTLSSCCCWSIPGVTPLCRGGCRDSEGSPPCPPCLGLSGDGEGLTDALELHLFFGTPIPFCRMWPARAPGGFCRTVDACPCTRHPTSPLSPQGPDSRPVPVPHWLW